MPSVSGILNTPYLTDAFIIGRKINGNIRKIVSSRPYIVEQVPRKER
jgi:hypothetical protein